jgi:hypothetical protein
LTLFPVQKSNRWMRKHSLRSFVICMFHQISSRRSNQEVWDGRSM